MALRVAFNATPLLSPLTGIGQYIVNLGNALAATRDVDAYSFYGYRWRHEAPRAPSALRVPRTSHRVRDVIKPLIPFKRELRRVQQQFQFSRGVRRYAVDVYHEPNYVPLECDAPVVITVHDLSWLHYPQMHPADRVRWLDIGLPTALIRASAILVDSDFVRHELCRTFAVDDARVHTAHLGVSADFRPRDALQTKPVLHPLGLSHARYLLTVGTLEPRKNLRHVLAAYARLPERLRLAYPLVVAGARGWRAEGLERELRALIDRGIIRFLGYVPQTDLPMLYAGAASFIFASLYEGFGLPPLEAMASGIPTLVADRASLPEVTGDAALLLDPQCPEQTAEKLELILGDPMARADWVQRGLQRAKAFTWAACAERTLAVYRSASEHR